MRSVQKQLQKPINIEEAVHSVLQKGYDPYIALCGWDTFLIWCYADGILSLYGVLQLKQFPYLVVCRGNTLCIWHFAIRRYFPYMMLCRKLLQPIAHDYTNHCYYPYMVFCRRHLPYMVSCRIAYLHKVAHTKRLTLHGDKLFFPLFHLLFKWFDKWRTSHSLCLDDVII